MRWDLGPAPVAVKVQLEHDGWVFDSEVREGVVQPTTKQGDAVRDEFVTDAAMGEQFSLLQRVNAAVDVEHPTPLWTLYLLCYSNSIGKGTGMS